jgi:hypothetical protein
MVDCQISALPSLPALLETPIIGFHYRRRGQQEHTNNNSKYNSYNPYDDMPLTPKPCRVMSPASTKRLLLDRIEQVEIPSLTPAASNKKLKRSLPPLPPTFTLSTVKASQSQQQKQCFQQALDRMRNGQALQRLQSLKDQETEMKEQAEEWAKEQVRQVFLNSNHNGSSRHTTTSSSSSSGSGDIDSGSSRNSPIRSASYHVTKTSLDGPAPPLRGRLERRNSARAA